MDGFQSPLFSRHAATNQNETQNQKPNNLLYTLRKTDIRFIGSVCKEVLQKVQTNSTSKERKGMAQRKLQEKKMARPIKPVGKIVQSNGVTKEVLHLWDPYEDEEELEEKKND